MTQLRTTFRLIASLGIGFVLSSGCMVHKVKQPTHQYLPTDATAEPKPGKWWAIFDDSQLDQLIDSSLEDNPDIRAVSLRMNQASGRYAQARGGLFPNVGANAGLVNIWNSDNSQFLGTSTEILLDWELDIFGRLRHNLKAQGQEVKATVSDWYAARLLLSASVAQTWFALIEQQKQLQLAKEQIKLSQTLLDLTRLRAGQGQGSAVAVLQQKEQLQSIQSRLPDIEERIQTLGLVLDSLQGRLPGSNDYEQLEDWIGISKIGVTEVSTHELWYHPQLQAAWARIIALDHRVGEAIADRLPRLMIGGSAGSDNTPQLVSLLGNAFARVTVPIVDFGSRKAEVAIRRYRLEEARELFSAEFLEIVLDVKTALVREEKLMEKLSRQEAQLQTAKDLLDESRNRYILGASDYLPVLDAVAKVNQLERDLLTTQRQRLSARIDLHRAMGGPMPEVNLP